MSLIVIFTSFSMVDSELSEIINTVKHCMNLLKEFVRNSPDFHIVVSLLLLLLLSLFLSLFLSFLLLN